MGLPAWTWPKQDDRLTPLDRFIRNVNIAMKKLENMLSITSATVEAVGTFANGATTPNVSEASVWKTNNSAPTTVTQFIGGAAGKAFDLIAGDANTTLKHDVTKLRTKTGADRALAANDTTRFVSYDGVVYREVPTP